MEVLKKHFLDTDDDGEGNCSFHYEGDRYQLVFGDRTYICTVYAGETEANFQNCLFTKPPLLRRMRQYLFDRCARWLPYTVASLLRRETDFAFASIPYSDPDFMQCIDYFLRQGITSFKAHVAYSEKGYEPVDLEKLRRGARS